ncbi:hypothetical protein DFH28DRAFT_898477 [Melampsora americana]|nr:hypothetical protein DFH28DRAFT_898647 [Melampsora americana]KAH9812684.1 hypothetical protein DFH28DRAFT_898477 [Melampsora americana]
MPLSKATRAQRKRRKAELAQKAVNSDSDSESDITFIENPTKTIPTSPANTIWSLPKESPDCDQAFNIDTDIEMDTDDNNNNNANNQIVHIIQQNLLDSEDEEMCDQGVVNSNLWPVFLQRDELKPSVGKRVNKDGVVMKGYKNPIQHTDTNNPKLMSRPIAKQTRSYRNKKMKKALGSGPSIASYFSQSTTITHNTSNNSLDDKHNEESDGEKEESDDNNEDTLYNDMIDSRVQQYQETQKIAKGPVDILQKINDQWEELNSALCQATANYERKHKSNPQFTIPEFEITELREFNSRRKELSIAKAKSPAITASILTAQASCRRLPETKRPKFISGIGRARKIRVQAAHIVRFKELSFSKAGTSQYQAHPSLLDNESIRKELLKWSITQKPGDVSSHFLAYCPYYLL